MVGPRELAAFAEQNAHNEGADGYEHESLCFALWEIATQLAAANDLAEMKMIVEIERCPHGTGENACDACKAIRARLLDS